MIPSNWPKASPPFPFNYQTYRDAYFFLLERRLIRLDGHGFEPSVPLSEAFTYCVDTTQPGLARAVMAFQLSAHLYNRQHRSLSERVTATAAKTSPPRQSLYENCVGGRPLDRQELDAMVAALKEIEE